MKETFVHKDMALTSWDTDVPSPKAGQVLIRAVVSGTNPKDWKMPPLWPAGGTSFNQGDDIAGDIERMGDDLVGFTKGDRVAAFHQVTKPHGSYADFEEAARIPLAALTAALGLYQTMKLPLPWNPTINPIPLVIYGGATAVGAFTIKFASVSNIHPIITIAGNGIPFVKTLLSPEKEGVVIDYRDSDEAVRTQIKAASGTRPVNCTYDAVSEKGSFQNIGCALTGPGEMAIILPSGEFSPPEGVGINQTIEHAEFGAAFFQLIGRGLRQGWFEGHLIEVRPGGLARLEGALQDLKKGMASAVKYVVHVGETEGVQGF
ncbi:hypothetical protein BJX99DRAFT_272832 [Aspergillus californicus]